MHSTVIKSEKFTYIVSKNKYDDYSQTRPLFLIFLVRDHTWLCVACLYVNVSGALAVVSRTKQTSY